MSSSTCYYQQAAGALAYGRRAATRRQCARAAIDAPGAAAELPISAARLSTALGPAIW